MKTTKATHWTTDRLVLCLICVDLLTVMNNSVLSCTKPESVYRLVAMVTTLISCQTVACEFIFSSLSSEDENVIRNLQLWVRVSSPYSRARSDKDDLYLQFEGHSCIWENWDFFPVISLISLITTSWLKLYFLSDCFFIISVQENTNIKLLLFFLTAVSSYKLKSALESTIFLQFY